MKIEGTQFDRRRKLSLAQKEEIKYWYNVGGWSKTKLAQRFGVSVNAIRFIVDPAVYEQWLKNRKRRGGEKQYYNASANTKKMRNYRIYVKYISAYATKQQLQRWTEANAGIMLNANAAADALKSIGGK